MSTPALPLPDELPIRELEIAWLPGSQGLAVRCINSLMNEQHGSYSLSGGEPVTVRHVRQWTDAQLLRLPNFGRRSLALIRTIIPHDPADHPVDQPPEPTSKRIERLAARDPQYATAFATLQVAAAIDELRRTIEVLS